MRISQGIRYDGMSDSDMQSWGKGDPRAGGSWTTIWRAPSVGAGRMARQSFVSSNAFSMGNHFLLTSFAS